MLLVEDCRGSAEGMVVNFCCAQVVTPTSTGSMGVGSGLARSNQRKLLFIGAMVSATGLKVYNR